MNNSIIADPFEQLRKLQDKYAELVIEFLAVKEQLEPVEYLPALKEFRKSLEYADLVKKLQFFGVRKVCIWEALEAAHVAGWVAKENSITKKK